jgi:hypothetical protein
MTFEKQPYANLYPVLADFDDDADEELEQVKQLSLITAAQDDERRRTKSCPANNTAGPTAQRNSSSQAVRNSGALPELLVDAHRSAIGNVPGVAITRAVPELADRSVSSQIARPRPQATIANGQQTAGPQPTSTSSGVKITSVPPPLPSVGPNASWNRAVNFPVVVPHRGRPAISSYPGQYNSSFIRSHSVSPPFGKSGLAVKHQAVMPERHASAAEFDLDAPLINLSPPYQDASSLDFDLNDLDPLRQPSVQASGKSFSSAAAARSFNVSHPLSDSNRVHSASVLPQPASNFGSRSVNTWANSECAMYGLTRPVAPNYGWNWMALGIDSIPPPQPASVSQSTSVLTSVFNRSPLMDQVDASSNASSHGYTISSHSTSSQATDTLRSSTSSSGYTQVSSPSPESTLRQVPVTMGTSDLMDFSLDSQNEPQFISLQDFDPLYSPECDICARCQCFESDELFSKPEGVTSHYQSESNRPLSNFQQPSSDSGRMRMGLPSSAQPETVSLPAQHSVDELQDPFSIHDLTIALEKKRQRHAQEQEARAKQMESSRIPMPASEGLMPHKTRPKVKKLIFLCSANVVT